MNEIILLQCCNTEAPYALFIEGSGKTGLLRNKFSWWQKSVDDAFKGLLHPISNTSLVLSSILNTDTIKEYNVRIIKRFSKTTYPEYFI